VDEAPSTRLGVPKGRKAVVSRRGRLDKAPWSELPSLEGAVESIFLCPAFLGESIAPFRILSTLQAVIPTTAPACSVVTTNGSTVPGLAAWWRRAEEAWLEHRSSDKRSLIQQLDYMKQ